MEDNTGTWIIEGKTDDDVLDFLASSANKHIVKKNPKKNNKRKLDDQEFEKDEQGRMIIEDEDDNDVDMEDSGEDEDMISENPPKRFKLSTKKSDKKKYLENIVVLDTKLKKLEEMLKKESMNLMLIFLWIQNN